MLIMSATVTLIKGNDFTDARGTLKFVNEFSFPEVKRFYQIVHPTTATIRAWQGHQLEHKYFYVVKGAFAIAWVKVDDWDNPSPDLKAEYEILEEKGPAVLSVPAGYANGIKAVIPDSVLMIFSNLTLEESAHDRWSFDPALWLDWKLLNVKAGIF
jgi:dTDP-4-dehydrorhamnose 3,5-epimerase-like enzyme